MKYFTIHELTLSATASRLGIPNTPTLDETAALTALVDNVLDPARQRLGAPVFVTSGYRSPRLNKAVGGVPNSQHQRGEAADITLPNPRDNIRLAKIIAQQNQFDQLILENANLAATECQWLHVSYSRTGNRHQILIKHKGSSAYKPYTLR